MCWTLKERRADIMAAVIERAVVGPLATNAWIVRKDQDSLRAVIVDPGGHHERLIRALRERNAALEAILLTHGHYDHIMAVNELRAAWPDAKVCILDAERPMIENSALNCGFFPEGYTICPDLFVSDGDRLSFAGMTFEVMASPGHTVGSCCYYMPDEGVLFSGDTVFRESYGRTDLPTGSTRDLMQSLEKILTSLPPETAVLPGHGGETTVAYERMAEGF